MDERSLTVTALVIAAGAGTYLWRGAGVWIAGRVKVDSPWFQWVTFVAFAMIAGLVCRVVFLPVGVLADTAIGHRLIAVAIGVFAFRLTRKNLLAGVLAGAASLPLLDALA